MSKLPPAKDIDSTTSKQANKTVVGYSTWCSRFEQVGPFAAILTACRI